MGKDRVHPGRVPPKISVEPFLAGAFHLHRRPEIPRWGRHPAQFTRAAFGVLHPGPELQPGLAPVGRHNDRRDGGDTGVVRPRVALRLDRVLQTLAHLGHGPAITHRAAHKLAHPAHEREPPVFVGEDLVFGHRIGHMRREHRAINRGHTRVGIRRPPVNVEDLDQILDVLRQRAGRPAPGPGPVGDRLHPVFIPRLALLLAGLGDKRRVVIVRRFPVHKLGLRHPFHLGDPTRLLNALRGDGKEHIHKRPERFPARERGKHRLAGHQAAPGLAQIIEDPPGLGFGDVVGIPPHKRQHLLLGERVLEFLHEQGKRGEFLRTVLRLGEGLFQVDLLVLKLPALFPPDAHDGHAVLLTVIRVELQLALQIRAEMDLKEPGQDMVHQGGRPHAIAPVAGDLHHRARETLQHQGHLFIDDLVHGAHPLIRCAVPRHGVRPERRLPLAAVVALPPPEAHPGAPIAFLLDHQLAAVVQAIAQFGENIADGGIGGG